MIFLITFIKFLIVFSAVFCIVNNFESKDTSVLYTHWHKKANQFSMRKMSRLEKYFKKISIPFNEITLGIVFGIGMGAFLLVLLISNYLFDNLIVRYIISLPFLASGIVALEIIAEKKQEKLEDGLSDFFIQLKSALKVNTEIIEALRKIQNNILEPFSTYTKQMLNEINAGKLPEEALESFASKIGIEKFSFYINNVRYCHIYGGNIYLLTQKTQEVINEAIKQKKKRKTETKAACTVLYILIIIDFYMYFSFIASNQYYLHLMNETFIGQAIVNINFICDWIMIWLSKAIKKLDY